jgi:hemolysin activation/secretion protein
VQLKTWHIYTYAGLDNLGSATVGPWQAYATAAYNSLLRPGDTLAVNLFDHRQRSAPARLRTNLL